MGGQFGVKDKFFGKLARALLPKLDELENLVVLLFFPQVGVGIAEEPFLAVLGQERQNSLLAAASLGNVMLLEQRVFAVERNRVKVEIERRAVLQTQLSHSVEPVAHQLRMSANTRRM